MNQLKFCIFCFFTLYLHTVYCESKPYDLLKDYKIYYVNDLKAHFYIDDVPDGIKWHLKKGIYWESNIGRLIRENTRPGSIALDIGAHIGIHTITMSRKVGSRGGVFAFEPQNKMHFELINNLKLNNCKNVSVVKKALGDEHKSVQLNARNPENEGGTAIGSGGDVVEQITLDSLNLNNVSLIKMDVERYELHVFKGAIETIKRNKPVIIFELLAGYDYLNCEPEIKAQFDHVINFVRDLGYKVDLIFGSDYIAFPI